MVSLNQVFLGLVLSAGVGLLAYGRGSLTRSGVIGAIIIGTATFGFGGLTWGLVLIAFFVSSSLLSHYREAQKAAVAEKFDKGRRRDLGQTLANGGFGALLALLVLLLVDLPGEPRSGNPTYIFLALSYFGAMATVNADTWATELGVLSSETPRLITTGQPVTPGTSGGVTWRGTLASLAGGAFIGLFAFLVIQVAALVSTGSWLGSDWPIILLAGLAGLMGSLFDSLLGATVQRIYWCPACEKQTERRVHSCGGATESDRGWAWLNNDRVNFLASAVGGLLAGGLGLIILI
jgi:uncharacterized protein (TIGR00297 family)